MKYRAWHIPQVPGPAFYLEVCGPVDAKILLDALAQYDLFQFQNKIKPDYCNAQGLEIEIDGEWVEWDQDGDDISHFVVKTDRCGRNWLESNH